MILFFSLQIMTSIINTTPDKSASNGDIINTTPDESISNGDIINTTPDKSISNGGIILIGCGLPRSGTLTTKTALDILLPGKCHHIVTAFNHQTQWQRIIAGKADDQEFQNYFIRNNFTAGVDSPVCFEYKRLMKIFPNAKVLLNIRDPEKWAISVQKTILKDVFLEFPASVFNWLHLFEDYLGLFPTLLESLYRMKDYNKMVSEVRKDRGEEFYHDWVAEVESYVPPEKLLKFNVAQGWEPLCKFLDLPIPEESFPRANSSQEFLDRLGKRRRRSWLLLYEFVTLPLFSALTYFHCYYQ